MSNLLFPDDDRIPDVGENEEWWLDEDIIDEGDEDDEEDWEEEDD